MPELCWVDGAQLLLNGVTREQAERAAGRWCSSVQAVKSRSGEGLLRLEVPPVARWAEGEPGRYRIAVRIDTGSSALELRVGPHAVVTGTGQDPDLIRLSSSRPPSPFGLDLLVDLGINHILARQGLPVLHSCAFELRGRSVLGLGESFSGKTTVSVAAMRGGGRVVSDDVVLAVPDDNGLFSLLPVRSYGWLRGRTRDIVPGELRDKMVETDENGQSRWVLNREDGGDRFAETAIPEVIWVQSVDRRLQESRIEAIDHGHVFAALIRASSPLYLSRHCPEIRDKLIPVFRALCGQCRGYRVRLGRRLLEDPEGEMTRLVGLSR